MQMRHQFVAVARVGIGIEPVPAPSREARVKVALVDAVSGAVHRVRGHPVVIRTSDPSATAAALLRNRDPRE